MAKKRTKLAEAAAAAAAAIAATQDDDEPGEIDIGAAELTEEVLEGLRRLDEGGKQITWRVYCDVPPEGKRGGYIAKLRTDQLDEGLFKTQYGPGEYRVVGKDSEGQYVRGAHAVIRISDIGAPSSHVPPATDPVALLRGNARRR